MATPTQAMAQAQAFQANIPNPNSIVFIISINRLDFAAYDHVMECIKTYFSSASNKRQMRDVNNICVEFLQYTMDPANIAYVIQKHFRYQLQAATYRLHTTDNDERRQVAEAEFRGTLNGIYHPPDGKPPRSFFGHVKPASIKVLRDYSGPPVELAKELKRPMKAHHNFKLAQKKAARTSSATANNGGLPHVAGVIAAYAPPQGILPVAAVTTVAFAPPLAGFAPPPPPLAQPPAFAKHPAFAQPPSLIFAPPPPQRPAYHVNVAYGPQVVTGTQLGNIYQGPPSLNGIQSIRQWIEREYTPAPFDISDFDMDTIPVDNHFSMAFDALASAMDADTNHFQNVSPARNPDVLDRDFLADAFPDWHSVIPHGLRVQPHEVFTRRVVVNGVPQIHTYSQADLVNNHSIVSERHYFP